MSSLRLPRTLITQLGSDAGEAALRHELMEERATSLGRAGRKAEAALAALATHRGEGRAEAVEAASDAVWSFLVQRELLGLRDRERIVADYAVPREVLIRLGCA